MYCLTVEGISGIDVELCDWMRVVVDDVDCCLIAVLFDVASLKEIGRCELVAGVIIRSISSCMRGEIMKVGNARTDDFASTWK